MVIPLILGVLGAFGGSKLGQAIMDEDYPGDTVPDNAREKLISQHVAENGWTCTRCSRQRRDLQADHIIPIAQGGRNSWQNLQVLCSECNQKKGDTHTWLEELIGRRR